ncbi:VPLPA-CTERM-specific exosortase XrtD [Rhodobacteraceae bacterium CYK-10]|uniref:VPLPA-CTERM-specific exosortase XrtD n=2 Tax=Stagnihabitans tardus TaxID=2699202 RepID=A0AAE4YEU6_9RHOB|nr:VPLPA-CTERM-specific exosortase XrtD [Stagnihabitans tardus]NBZ90038.1 VPLPA-CTERM-specific exosortase XrtD [Stagnihabitans tardus]
MGLFWFLLALLSAGVYFQTGVTSLAKAWALPEYSHGPLIPLLSLFLFLRHLKRVPVRMGPVSDRGAGLAVVLLAMVLGGIGRLLQIDDFAAYAMILWTGGMLLLSFGWRQGRQFWPPVLHLVYMLPLPGVLYYGLSTWLQWVSSNLGVWFLHQISVPVFLDGNIIDLGVYKLQVAEACSGLRYLFPILSFSYIFAVLYRGPIWHKAVLLISAAPITVFMNSVRIAIAGAVVDRYGIEHVEGVSHFMEGWVIFVACVAILFGLARVMLLLNPQRMGVVEALDLDFDGLWAQAQRIRLIEPSRALIVAALVMGAGALAWAVIPPRPMVEVAREPFHAFPAQLGAWVASSPQSLDPQVAKVLAADDYHSVTLTKAGERQPVDLFMAWYKDQMTGGTHSPTICLPSAGWEIAGLQSVPAPEGVEGAPFTLNRTVIQKGMERMLVYYWYDQQGVRTASSYYAKLSMTLSKLETGRSDGAIVRLITPIGPGESDSAAEARLQDALRAVVVPLPRFLPKS